MKLVKVGVFQKAGSTMRNALLSAGRGLLSAAALAILAGGTYADEIKTRTWTGNGADNLWTNPDNWEPSEVSDASYNNVFPAGRDCEVKIDTAPFYHSLQLPEGPGTVTFKGTGQLQADNTAYIQVGAGREINVDGVVFRLCKNSCSENAFINGTLRLTSRSMTTYGSSDNYHVIGGNAKVIVEGGEFGASNSYLCLTNNATLTVRGGLVRCARYTFCSPDAPRESITRVKLLGGTFWNPSSYAYTMVVQDGAHLEFLGGRLIWGSTDSLQYNCLDSQVGQYSPGNYFADCLPQFGGELVIPTCTTHGNGAMKFYYSNRNYDFGGTVYVTNNCNNAGVQDAAAGTVYFYGEGGGTLSIRGGATLFANTLKIYAKILDITNNLDLTRLNLGIGGIRREDENGGSYFQYFNFLDGIEFGAWGGDVPRSGAARSRLLVRPQGPVVFDTKDCFDPTTSRTINMDCIRLDDVTDLKATGGGTVALYPGATWTGEFRTLEVSDNTTLAFCTNNLANWESRSSYISGVKAMNLKLGANAKVKINMSFGDYVDASSTAEFGEGAKIVVADLPATLTEGMFYPVYFAPAGTDPDLSKIEYAEGEWPGGWYLAKRGCAVYLTDGKEPVHSDSNKYAWSGGGSDNLYSNMDNWLGYINTNGGADIYYNGRKNTDIYIDNTGLVQRRWVFGADAGPFLFGGNLVKFQYPNSFNNLWSPSINSDSRFPVVVTNKLAAQGFALWMAARKQGSISLMGLGCMTNTLSNQYVPLFVGGDIRIGGAYTSEYVRVASDTWDSYVKRATRLTIMPGGSLKVLNQSGDFHERGKSGSAASYGVTGGALAVATGGVLDIAGTELLFTCDATHYVDGAMTVSCPLVPQGRQTFRGDGTLTLAGGVSSAAGGVRVEGNLTLVPSDWTNDAVLSVKDNVTIAPTGDWTFGGDATLDLVHHSTLTLATGGHKLRLAKPIVSNGDLAVTGNGTVEIAAEGMSLNRVTMADGAQFSVAGDLLASGMYVDVLTVREDDASIAFPPDVCRLRKRVDENGHTVYSVKGTKGMMLIFR